MDNCLRFMIFATAMPPYQIYTGICADFRVRIVLDLLRNAMPAIGSDETPIQMFCIVPMLVLNKNTIGRS